MERYSTILEVSLTPGERVFCYIFQEKQNQNTQPKATLALQRFYNFPVHYKSIFLSKCPWSEKGTDFQTPRKLTPALNITPISRAHFQVPKLKSSPCHSLLVKSTIFVSIIGFLLRCEFFSRLSQLFNRRLFLDSLIFRWFLSPCLVQWFLSPGKRDASPHRDINLF